MKKLKITVEGRTYEVSVEVVNEGAAAPAPAPVTAASVGSAPPPAPAATPAASGPGLVQSPLAGKVVSLQVTVGQQVKAGDQLIVLEAMKMNTYVNAPQDGSVAEILVKPGDATEEGQTLIRLA